jgi:3-methyladenine DNA glycosylase AlkD
MHPPPELIHVANTAKEIRARLAALDPPRTAPVRALRREFSRRIAGVASASVMQLALLLLRDNSNNSDVRRFFTYELVSQHRHTCDQLTTADLLTLGHGLNSWSSVDCFAMYLSGPMWMQDRISDETLVTWTSSEDRWWRRAALVSTIARSRRGDPGDSARVARVCTLLAEDREDMVVKALSWALRELAKKHPQPVRAFLAGHRHLLAARVLREVNNKLSTGLKTPRSAR